MNPAIAILSIAAVAFWLGYFYWAFRMIRGRKEGVRSHGREVGWNPFNLCFRPSLLTGDGLQARKWFFICMVGCPGFILLILILGGAF
jgi:hypothetical protein